VSKQPTIKCGIWRITVSIGLALNHLPGAHHVQNGKHDIRAVLGSDDEYDQTGAIHGRYTVGSISGVDGLEIGNPAYQIQR